MYVPLRLDDVVATLMISDTCLDNCALLSAAELVLTCISRSSETYRVAAVANLLFLPLDADDASDERDANAATDSSSSDLVRARDPPAVDIVASSTGAGARKTPSDRLALLVLGVLGGSMSSSGYKLLASPGVITRSEAWRSTPERPWS